MGGGVEHFAVTQPEAYFQALTDLHMVAQAVAKLYERAESYQNAGQIPRKDGPALAQIERLIVACIARAPERYRHVLEEVDPEWRQLFGEAA